MEQFYEQNVVNNNIDERAKKTKTLVVAKTIFLVLGLFILTSSAVLLELFWIFLLISIPFFIISYVIGIFNKRNNTEYDYVLDDENLKISEIYYRERRKLKHTIRLRNIESVGVFDSEGYKKVENSASKKILAIVNYEDEQSVVYILFNTDKGKKIIFIEPDRGFMIALRRVVSALTVFDKSIADFEKRLSAKEAELKAAEEDDDDYSDEDETEAPDLNDDEEEKDSQGPNTEEEEK